MVDNHRADKIPFNVDCSAQRVEGTLYDQQYGDRFQWNADGNQHHLHA